MIAFEHLGIAPLTGKLVKMFQKSAVFDHKLFDGHKADFDNFSILLKESNGFKLYLKESFLKSQDTRILDENMNFFPLELFH